MKEDISQLQSLLSKYSIINKPTEDIKKVYLDKIMNHLQLIFKDKKGELE